MVTNYCLTSNTKYMNAEINLFSCFQLSPPREMDAQAIMEDLRAKREALDMAIADIKTAIQRSKQVALESPHTVLQEETAPVWVKRSDIKIKITNLEELYISLQNICQQYLLI